MSVEIEVAQFGLDIEICERLAVDEDTADLVDLWCRVGLADYSGTELLERVCRHVNAITTGGRRNKAQHIRSLERIANEIERRLEFGNSS